LLERLGSVLREDSRIGGAVHVGSGAREEADRWADLDVVAVVQRNEDALNVFGDWREALEGALPVLWCFEDVRGPEVGLYAIILEDFMELDISFQSLGVLSAHSPNWRILFDRTDEIEAIMSRPPDRDERAELEETYCRRLDSIWHYVTHVAVSIKRGKPWRALFYLQEMRDRTIEIEGLLCECTTKHFREVDDLPADRLAALERTLVGTVRADTVAQVLIAATECFFDTAARAEEACGIKRAENLRTAMGEYLELMGIQR
jgi:hypothetical protein